MWKSYAFAEPDKAVASAPPNKSKNRTISTEPPSIACYNQLLLNSALDDPWQNTYPKQWPVVFGHIIWPEFVA